MPAKDFLSTALLLFSIMIGPLIFFLTIVIYGVKRTLSTVAEHRKQRYLRSLPCSNCRYFTNNEFLPCTVNPIEALTEEAHHCHDFSKREAINEYSSYLRTLFSPAPKLKTPKRSLEKLL